MLLYTVFTDAVTIEESSIHTVTPEYHDRHGGNVFLCLVTLTFDRPFYPKINGFPPGLSW